MQVTGKCFFVPLAPPPSPPPRPLYLSRAMSVCMYRDGRHLSILSRLRLYPIQGIDGCHWPGDDGPVQYADTQYKGLGRCAGIPPRLSSTRFGSGLRFLALPHVWLSCERTCIHRMLTVWTYVCNAARALCRSSA